MTTGIAAPPTPAPRMQSQIARLAQVTPDEVRAYMHACHRFVNGVAPEVLVGNYTGHLAMHHDVVMPTLTRIIQPHDRVLDFGCGVGRVTALCAARAKMAIGVDISWVALSRAARIVPEALFMIIPGDGSLPFPPESVDVIVSMICLQHIQFFPIRHAYIQSMHRILRQRGRVLLQLNASTGGKCVRWFDRGQSDVYMAPDVACDEQEITSYLTALGFAVRETWRTHADSQDVSWDICPRKTSSEWLWVVAERQVDELVASGPPMAHTAAKGADG